MAESRTEKVTLVGGALAAFAASVCCLGPLVLVALGVSGAWIGNLAALEAYRPAFIGAALVLMVLAWRRIYRAPATETCAPGSACALPLTNRTRTYKIMFWLVAALVLLALAFPYILPFFY